MIIIVFISSKLRIEKKIEKMMSKVRYDITGNIEICSLFRLHSGNELNVLCRNLDRDVNIGNSTERKL